MVSSRRKGMESMDAISMIRFSLVRFRISIVHISTQPRRTSEAPLVMLSVMCNSDRPCSL